MKKQFTSILCLLGLVCNCTCLFAQENKQFMQHIGVALNAGTTGGGIEASTYINSHFALRAGFNTLPFGFDYNYENNDLALNMKCRVKFFNAKALVDWYPVKNGIFHFSAGVYLGSLRLDAAGTSTKPFDFGGWQITPDEMGNLDVKLKGSPAKPYLGIGLGRTIPHARWGFKMDLGAMYFGSPRVVAGASGLISPTAGEASKVEDNIADYCFYPVLSFQLIYRIF